MTLKGFIMVLLCLIKALLRLIEALQHNIEVLLRLIMAPLCIIMVLQRLIKVLLCFIIALLRLIMALSSLISSWLVAHLPFDLTIQPSDVTSQIKFKVLESLKLLENEVLPNDWFGSSKV
eukprot:TCONS_00029050-protein